jgi:putative protease
MELFVYAASAESAEAAIQNGAGGVILSPSIQPETLDGLFPYANAGGVKIIYDLTRACDDAEFSRRAEVLETLYGMGLDAVMSGEPGLLRMAVAAAPGCKHIWGAPCETADDIDFAAANGCSMAVLSPFLQDGAIKALAANTPVPLLIWVLSPICPAGGHGCLLDNKRLPHSCAQSCRTPLYAYSGDNIAPILKTKDLCLLKHMRDLNGLTAMIKPPDPNPEATGLFTRFARIAADEHYVNNHELDSAFEALGRERPTDALYTGTGQVYSRGERERNERVWESVCRKMADQPVQTGVPVRFFALITAGEPARLAVDDYQGHTLYAEGDIPVHGGESCEEELNGIWSETSGGYLCKDARTKIDAGLTFSRAQAAALRDEVLLKLERARLAVPERENGKYNPGVGLLPRADLPVLTVRVTKMSQVTEELLSLPPERLYIPLDEASGDPAKAEWLVKSDTVPVVVLPRVYSEEDRAEINARLRLLHNAGFREALAWTPGQAHMVLKQGFTPRCDWGTSSSYTLKAVKAMGVASCTLAPWMSFKEIGQMSHFCDTELVVYGRIPLLLARSCIIRAQNALCVCDNKCELSDGKGGVLPLLREGVHSTLVYHSQKLWMLPYRARWRHIGLWAARLDFTTENAVECAKIALAYAGRGDYEPHAFTTGFYIEEEIGKRRGRKI